MHTTRPDTSQDALRFVTWNCLSCYPQYYDDLKWIKSGAQDGRLLYTNLGLNHLRYRAIVRKLVPYLQQVVRRSLHAICLQEVDKKLLEMLHHLQRTDRRFADVQVHQSNPYVWDYAKRSEAPKGTTSGTTSGTTFGTAFAYSLVTILHRKQPTYNTPTYNTPTHTKYSSYSSGQLPQHKIEHKMEHKIERCLVTRVGVYMLYNIHMPWVRADDIGSERKVRRNRQIVERLSTSVRHMGIGKAIVLGDLNLSSEFNQKLYAEFFPSKRFATTVFGESYKLSPEHVKRRTTFRSVSQTPDDGCIVHASWTTSHAHASLKETYLPVDARGWFLPTRADMSPSDHALVEVGLDRRRKTFKRSSQYDSHSRSHKTRQVV
jgi:hypothetical protein